MYALFSSPLLFNYILLFRAFNQLLPVSSHSPLMLMQDSRDSFLPFPSNSSCNTQYRRCGGLDIPFPFHLNSSACPFLHCDVFRLSCVNDTTLFLNISSLSYRISEFFADGVLVDFPREGTTSFGHYLDFNFFGFEDNAYYGISVQNVLGLYDCEDSSVCKDVDYCDQIKPPLPTCPGNSTSSITTTTTCGYPLSDHSVWETDDAFSVFSEFGCRGFSSWIFPPGTKSGKRGVIPRDSSKALCATNAVIINATAVKSGVRCACQNGSLAMDS
ncbi:hypothetical protein IFM89_036831 [Coptis chinensis]|uniref:Wall-associated receptor kinase galacturonan-binding domain-containing protein n=1 Tax=Coptis chinensis TaxID=261450 RepID=A0A835LFM4_9MAGN|nr:hypothetical protein IFM89_036831 [Coptis chinensis]